MKCMVILAALFLVFSWPLQAQQIFRVDDAVAERNFMPNELPFYIDGKKWKVAVDLFSPSSSGRLMEKGL